jgi:hypothetical protein
MNMLLEHRLLTLVRGTSLLPAGSVGVPSGPRVLTCFLSEVLLDAFCLFLRLRAMTRWVRLGTTDASVCYDEDGVDEEGEVMCDTPSTILAFSSIRT